MLAMDTPSVLRIYLIGPSGSGKTSTAARVADLLAWAWVDTDALVEQASGRSVSAIFRSAGESDFRRLESEALAQTARMERVVVATGGGSCERPENVQLMDTHGWLVSLVVSPEIAYQRMTAATEASTGLDSPSALEEEIAAQRPMLAGGQPLARLRWLHVRRSRQYEQADDIIVTNDLAPEEVAARIVAGLVARGLLAGPDSATSAISRKVEVATQASYHAMVAWRALASLGSRLAELGLPRRLHVVADAVVARLYEPAVMSALLAADFDPLVYRVPSGESSKSRDELFAIYDWLAERRAERSEAVISLGGGVVGDLAGFAAATYLRGLPFVQVPTSLLAQVDASIGGKVGINHPHGKNLLGTFYQPLLVLTDPATLLTLPARQRTEGWAEVIKHGVALDADYFETLEREAEALLSLQPEPLTRIIARSVSLKVHVIEADERERDGGRRHLLNYGHTIGHAIESVAGYGIWLHGEAVAAGMMAEAALGLRLGISSPELVTRQAALLARYGLPTRLDGLSASALLFACLWDKKVRDGRTRWVLPTELGQATLVADVAEADVRAALLELGAGE